MVQDGAPSDENLFVAQRSGRGWSSSAKPVLGRVNTRINEGASSISADGEYMVFTACNRPDGVGSCDLYYSYFDPLKGWGFPELLPGKSIQSAGRANQPGTEWHNPLFCPRFSQSSR